MMNTPGLPFQRRIFGAPPSLNRLFWFIALALTSLNARAQDPGAQQDAEAEREKVLKAVDQIDLIETNSEANRVTLESLKADVAQLKADQTSLRQQLADTQAALAQSEQARLRERKVLLAEVAAIVASPPGPGGKHSDKSAANHMVKAETESAPPATTSTPYAGTASADTRAVTKAPATTTQTSTAASPPSSPGATPTPKPQRGYYHVVEKDETLSRIVAAYREQGVQVTLAQVRRANSLDETSTLYVGEKLFIPKPGIN